MKLLDFDLFQFLESLEGYVKLEIFIESGVEEYEKIHVDYACDAVNWVRNKKAPWRSLVFNK